MNPSLVQLCSLADRDHNSLFDASSLPTPEDQMRALRQQLDAIDHALNTERPDRVPLHAAAATVLLARIAAGTGRLPLPPLTLPDRRAAQQRPPGLVP